MVHVVGGGEDLGLVDVVDVDGLENLRLCDVANAALCHDGDGHSLLDAANHRRIAHAGDPTGGADVCGDALEGHDGAGSGRLCNACLLGGGDVHDDAALEHLRELAVEASALLAGRDVLLCHAFLLCVAGACAGYAMRNLA